MIKIPDILSLLENSAFIRRLFGLLPGPLRRLLDSQRNFVYALLVHVLCLSIFVLSFDWSAEPVPSKPKVNVIDAVVIDESRVQAEIEKLKKAERQRQQQDDARKRQLKKEEQHLAELKKKKADEQRRLQEQQKKRKAEEQRAKELAIKKKAETESLNKLKKEQEAIKKEQQALEKKRQDEQKRLAELEKKRQLEEAERLRKQKEEQQRLEAERALQQQLADEQKALEAEQQRAADRVVNQYVEIIKQQVARNWRQPDTATSGLSCTVAVSLMPGGDVLSARVTRGSGDPIFDRSVETAVLKASPLQLPPDAALFERFRDLEFIFNPGE